MKRNFTAQGPNHLWVTDRTQHHTDEGWLYLAAAIGAFSRKIVDRAMDERSVAVLAVEAVNMSIWNYLPERGFIHHSDHGCQDTALAFGRALHQHDIVVSMGSVGDALDNALTESCLATLQT